MGAIENIYLVEYKLIIGTGMYPHWCQDKVRCIAFDPYLAMSRVDHWLKTSKYIWWNTGDEIIDYKIPPGDRDVTIIKVLLHTADIGELLKQIPLPNIFPDE